MIGRNERTPQQRAAWVTYHLVMRKLAHLDGMTTLEIADALGMTPRAIRAMMCGLCAVGGVPLMRIEERWEIDVSTNTCR